MGLVSLCPSDWQRRVCDRPKRHRSPIRSTTLINFFKQTGSESGEKLSVPFKKPLKGNREGNLMTQEGWCAVFFFYQWPGTWVLCECMHVCLCGGERTLWGSVFTARVGQEWGAFWRIPDMSNLTFNLCVLSSIRDCKHTFSKEWAERIQGGSNRQLNIPERSSWTTASLLTPFSLVIDLSVTFITSELDILFLLPDDWMQSLVLL